jgi:hypothetical protein
LQEKYYPDSAGLHPGQEAFTRITEKGFLSDFQEKTQIFVGLNTLFFL